MILEILKPVELSPQRKDLLERLGGFGITQSVLEEVHEALQNEAQLAAEVERLQAEVYIDPKTGISSYQYFLDFIIPELRDHISHAETTRRQYEHDLYLGIGDINAMNLHNEQLTHQGGDRIIRDVATVLTKSVRDTDWVGRFGTGADEFSVLLRIPKGENAETIIGSVYSRINANLALIIGTQMPVSVSFGFAKVADYPTPDAAMAAADSAMYDIKNAWKQDMRSRGLEVSHRLLES